MQRQLRTYRTLGRRMPKPQKTVDSYISYALAAAHRKLHTELSQKLKALNVQVETWRVLQSLRASEGITMRELAEVVLMNPPTLTKLVDRMVADGLVQRQLSPEDQRRVQLALTDLGISVSDKIALHVEEQNDRIIEAIGSEKAKLLREALDTLT
ncbi:MarR family winged helix-turn-helix transcriptional regulator [Roseobacter sinensis]|uniref:MarR family transcriptional regulator n=1 Tax=Roseobacter sinensis TaxID=2931391 RepID=A0ABT3BE93_9RHOB|nr:MarR family transcriptional regulator [Roseobacter sp. WL0113]MCV3271896.1 MarR family transcriptional regulator [Roseobacter sp. WL0113]